MRSETIRSHQSEDMCCLHHRYAEGNSSRNRVCSLPSKHQCFPLTVKLKLNSPDPIRAFQHHLLARCGCRLWLSYFLEQCCRLLRGSPRSSCASEGEQASRLVDQVSHRPHQWLAWIANSLRRKIFGRNHWQDLTPDVVNHMSVNSLAAQRQQMEDAAFDSD
jgi:hypothetical protein